MQAEVARVLDSIRKNLKKGLNLSWVAQTENRIKNICKNVVRIVATEDGHQFEPDVLAGLPQVCTLPVKSCTVQVQFISDRNDVWHCVCCCVFRFYDS
jgi:hypothetical protein